MDRSRIGIIIPALNEENTVGRVISRTIQFGIPIVVDDGSADKTAEIARNNDAHVVIHRTNQGYDQALNSGFAYAANLGCEYIITIDADGQHNPENLATFIQTLEDGADVVIGIRDRQQRLAESIFSYVTFYKWGIRDPLCGMKAYRVVVYRTLGYFDSYHSIGTELMLFAAKKGFLLKQIPIITKERNDNPRFGHWFNANFWIIRALWRGMNVFR
jgi:glycosyltransferase involved in cell wall biosynthesis